MLITAYFSKKYKCTLKTLFIFPNINYKGEMLRSEASFLGWINDDGQLKGGKVWGMEDQYGDFKSTSFFSSLTENM